MLNYYSLINWLAAVVLALFALITWSGSASASSRQHARYAGWVALWAFLLGLYFALPLVSSWNLPLMRLLYWMGLSLFSNFFYFTLVYPSDEQVFPRVRRALFAVNVLLLFVYLFSDAVVQGIALMGVRPNDKPPIYGPLVGLLFTLPYVILILGGHVVLLAKALRAKEREHRRHVLYLLGASTLLFLPLSIVNVFLPFTQTYQYAHLGPPLTLLWVGFTAYAIFRQKILKLKLIVPQALVLTLVTIAFFNIFLQSEALTSLRAPGFFGGPSFNAYAGVIWVSSIIIGSFALIIFLGSSKRSSRLYALTSFWAMLWTLGMGAYHVTNSYQWIMFWGQWNHFMGGAIAATFFYFTFFFPDERSPRRWVLPTVLLPQLGFLYLYSFTTLVISDSFVTGTRVIDRGWHFGQLGYLFHFFFLLYFLGGFWNLLRKIRAAPDGVNRQDLWYVFWGTIVGVAPAGIVNVTLPLVGNFQYYWLGPTLILGWVAFLAYAIVRRQVLSVRVVLAEVAVLAMTLILFLNIFLSQVLNYGMIGHLIVFLAFSVVGMFFIASIRKSELQKEQLEALTHELRDLSENLQAKVDERTKELSHAAAHTETLIENLSTGLVEYSPDSVVLRVNRAAEQMLGISRDDAVGKIVRRQDLSRPGWRTLVSVSYPELVDSHAVDPATVGLEAGGGVAVHELTLTDPIENEFQVVSAPIVVPGARQEGTLKIIRNITRQRMIERSKSEFISVAAHQLRTPLSIMKWLLDLLLKGDYGLLQDEQREAIARSFDTNEKMIQLVNDLLNVARIEDHRFGYDFTESDLGELLSKIMDEYTLLAKGKPVTFQAQLPRDPWPRFFFDSEKIGLAIRNVLDNAFHYTPSSGTVTLAVKRMGEAVTIAVSDTGIGIPAAQKERLFTRFFRAANAIKMQTKGSGLGLFIVKSIMTRHGGAVDIDSQEGKGTTVRLTLPMSKTAIREFGS